MAAVAEGLKVCHEVIGTKTEPWIWGAIHSLD